MNITFIELNDEIEELILFLTSDSWPFHGGGTPSPEKIKESFKKNYYTGDENKTFWMILDNRKIGMIRLFDLQDNTPLFDIRIHSEFRGKGIGEIAVNWLTEYVFTTFEAALRIEAHTRQDNYGMRKVFHKCGYVKEAHFRKAWESEDGNYYDSIGYAVLKDDWVHKRVTEVNWEDYKY